MIDSFRIHHTALVFIRRQASYAPLRFSPPPPHKRPTAISGRPPASGCTAAAKSRPRCAHSNVSCFLIYPEFCANRTQAKLVYVFESVDRTQNARPPSNGDFVGEKPTTLSFQKKVFGGAILKCSHSYISSVAHVFDSSMCYVVGSHVFVHKLCPWNAAVFSSGKRQINCLLLLYHVVRIR